jgi:hypothetical protein
MIVARSGARTDGVQLSSRCAFDASHDQLIHSPSTPTTKLWRIEKSFPKSNHDLQGRPIYHRTRESKEAPDHRVRCAGRQPLD